MSWRQPVAGNGVVVTDPVLVMARPFVMRTAPVKGSLPTAEGVGGGVYPDAVVGRAVC